MSASMHGKNPGHEASNLEKVSTEDSVGKSSRDVVDQGDNKVRYGFLLG